MINPALPPQPRSTPLKGLKEKGSFYSVDPVSTLNQPTCQRHRKGNLARGDRAEEGSGPEGVRSRCPALRRGGANSYQYIKNPCQGRLLCEASLSVHSNGRTLPPPLTHFMLSSVTLYF